MKRLQSQEHIVEEKITSLAEMLNTSVILSETGHHQQQTPITDFYSYNI